METRSQRRQTQSNRPTYPQMAQSVPTSPSSSVFQSSSSLSSINTTMGQPSTSQQGAVSAPLPSPSSNQPTNYFGSFRSQPPTSHPTQQAQRIPQIQPMAAYVGQRGGNGGTPETAPFLKDCNLLAMAASKAQMHCVARDFDDMSL